MKRWLTGVAAGFALGFVVTVATATIRTAWAGAQRYEQQQINVLQDIRRSIDKAGKRCAR